MGSTGSARRTHAGRAGLGQSTRSAEGHAGACPDLL